MKKWFAVAGVALGVCVMSSTAQAQGPASCGYDYLQPFAAWGDKHKYGLAPSGSFETGAIGWTLEGGAAVADSSDPLREASGLYSLSLPAGSVATTPPICVEPGSPRSRMFAYTTVPNPSYSRAMKVELVKVNALTGRTHTRPAGRLKQRGSWAPTERFSLGGPLTVNPGRQTGTTVHYRFTPRHETAWLIDDLYIDPKRK